MTLEAGPRTVHIVLARESPFMPASRRRLLTASISLALSGVRPAFAARRSLTFAAYGGLFQELYEPAVVDSFGGTHADTDVFYYAVPTSSQALATLRRQRERPEIDVVLLDLPSARTATDEGLLEPLVPASMPVLADLAPSATFPGIAGRALFTEPLVLLFDAAKMPPPPSWKTLWSGLDDRSIAIPAPPDPVGIAFTIVAGRLFGGGNDQHAIADGIVAINELQRQVLSWNPSPDVYHMVGEGNAQLGVGWNMLAQVFSDRMNGRLGVAFPEEGTISRVTTVNLVKGSRQPDAARQLIAHLLGADAQRTMVEQMYLGPVNSRARYLESALLRTANTQERASRAMPVDWVSVAAVHDEILRRWREVIPGSG
jgi:putative spermidine/putrescine transport system substrate-binding protein